MLKKNNYYLLLEGSAISRIKIVHITATCYGYIDVSSPYKDCVGLYWDNNIAYTIKLELEVGILEDLGEHPDYSPDELPMNVFSNSTAE